MDKRKFLRFSINLDVGYRVLESLQGYKVTRSEDVCEKGIRINLPELLTPGTILELIIKIPDEAQPIAGIGKIVWVKKELLEDSFIMGIELVCIKKRDRERVFKYAVL